MVDSGKKILIRLIWKEKGHMRYENHPAMSAHPTISNKTI
jgi:hypothetical protein